MDIFETVFDTSVSQAVHAQPTGVAIKYLRRELIVRHIMRITTFTVVAATLLRQRHPRAGK
jgi:hypothetical protein